MITVKLWWWWQNNTISYGLSMANASNTLVGKLNRDFLECGICLDRFQKPRALPCQHSFCHRCSESFCKGRQRLMCPCTRLIEVPEEDVSGFRAHIMVNSLQETLDLEKLKVIIIIIIIVILYSADIRHKWRSWRFASTTTNYDLSL